MATEPQERSKLQYSGLTPAEVEASRKQHGANILTPPKRDPWWKLYFAKFEDPIIRILLIAAFVTVIVGLVDGSFAEGIGIVIAILLATTLSFLNEYRARQEFDILNRANDEIPINVIRDGVYTTVPRKDLVVGDIVLIEVGDEVSADGHLLEAVSLQANESLLTGESLPVVKYPSDGTMQPEDGNGTTLPPNKLFRGTTIVDGRGVMRVIAVGDRTRIGKIAREAAEETDEVTPLNAQLERLSKVIGVAGFAIALLTYVALVVRGVLTGALVLSGAQWMFTVALTVSVMMALSRIWLPIVYDAFELAGRPRDLPHWMEEGDLMGWVRPVGGGLAFFAAAVLLLVVTGLLPSTPSAWLPEEVGAALLRYFMVAVTIIVVAVPEGLPMSVTLSLAYSMRRMTATNNLVRHMQACETIGAATVICSDKTGTLTLNQMRVHETQFPVLDGAGTLRPGLPTPGEKLIAEAIAANTTANLSRVPGEPIRPIGDTTEGALLLWLDDQKIEYIDQRASFVVKMQLTFSADRKYMGTLGTSAVDGQTMLHIKGAPEIVLKRCTNILTSSGVEPIDGHAARIEDQLHGYQRRGMRALGFAYQPIAYTNGLGIEQLAENLTWLGFVAIADPIRPDVPDAIAACRTAGIQVKIVTGDNAETAQEIAHQVGLWEIGDEEKLGTIQESTRFGNIRDSQMLSLDDLKVLARARPQDKMRLVRLLQERGHVVAVTGDGTNDAPALNYANVGLAMGSGTDIAKEASDIILLDDSFASIVNAVMWGRSLYENIQRFILFQLTINVAALGIALLGPFIGVELPLTVIQMLWVNLIMDTFASLALATEPPHRDVMRRPPRRPGEFIITPVMARHIFGYGLAFIVLLVGILLVIQRDGDVSSYELSMFYTTFVLLQFWNMFNARSLGRDRSAFRGIWKNRAFLAIAAAILLGQVLIIQFGGSVFRTVPLALTDWIAIIAATSLVLWIGEAQRFFQRMQRVRAGLRTGEFPRAQV